MKIIITDGHTLNPGDLSWKPLHDFGEVIYYDRSKGDEIRNRCESANIIVTNKTPINADTIQHATELKMIAVTATGHNIVDGVAARQRGIQVCNVPQYGTDSVAQHTFALLLEATNMVGKHSRSVASGAWTKAKDWSYTLQPFSEIAGKTMGIVGFGRIGQRVAEIAKAFGMKVIFNNKEKTSSLAERVTIEELFATSDFISLHCPLTKENEGFVDRELLLFMKPTAILINTSRGQLINEQDLADGLKDGLLAAAALDVLSTEPPAENHPLIGLDNCILTPHVAWISIEARKRLLEATVENVKNFIEGKVGNVVN